ncbi:hypothetical protein LMG22037_04881 [Paraburkholderia phenoliruptrix]|uniref:Uncharacterized protein n=1 Tax=Paraburkholderia phenoliruptrix TaxID=252970 RepID=A0A6J5BZV2_9BURK|nr:hypothetical protein LMG22037_04881 [Paraburkholderia phenoliruptrix]
MRASDRQNIEVVEAWLKKRKKPTAGAFFVYALSPFPSNYLFIVYGLSGLPLRVIGTAFFAGRTISYSLSAHLGRFASSYLDLESPHEGGYLSGYFIVSQVAFLCVVYLLMKLDWKMLIEHRKLTCRRTVNDEPSDTRRPTAKR